MSPTGVLELALVALAAQSILSAVACIAFIMVDSFKDRDSEEKIVPIIWLMISTTTFILSIYGHVALDSIKL